MSLAINVQSSVTKRFYQEVVISDKQSIWRFEFRCAAAQKLRSVCKRALIVNSIALRCVYTCVVVIGKFVCFIMFRSRSAISTTRNFVQSCASARVRFDLRYAEIALGAICDFNYALMQIEMYEPGY